MNEDSKGVRRRLLFFDVKRGFKLTYGEFDMLFTSHWEYKRDNKWVVIVVVDASAFNRLLKLLKLGLNGKVKMALDTHRRGKWNHHVLRSKFFIEFISYSYVQFCTKASSLITRKLSSNKTETDLNQPTLMHRITNLENRDKLKHT